ncbi:MAG: hypothetical protein IJG02_06610 [Thermoguttaceae bacterium]|nr:hypothetical protein [Thermoguttaceae bacterium]
MNELFRYYQLRDQFELAYRNRAAVARRLEELRRQLGNNPGAAGNPTPNAALSQEYQRLRHLYDQQQKALDNAAAAIGPHRDYLTAHHDLIADADGLRAAIQRVGGRHPLRIIAKVFLTANIIIAAPPLLWALLIIDFCLPFLLVTIGGWKWGNFVTLRFFRLVAKLLRNIWVDYY